MPQFKVIDTSNHGNESVADVLIKSGFKSKEEAEQAANEHNKGRDTRSKYWAVAVPADRRLWRGMKELV